jgi:hypothetical protein
VKAAGHGTDLLDRDPGASAAIAEWLASELFKAAGLKKTRNGAQDG